ncbi:MAG: VOC family protein, partial [Terracidiphilus sp.]
MSHPEASPAVVNLEKIGQIAITVDDLARAKDFYQNTLGMKFLFDAGQLAFFKCGDIRLMLSAPEKSEPRGGTILYYKV